MPTKGINWQSMQVEVSEVVDRQTHAHLAQSIRFPMDAVARGVDELSRLMPTVELQAQVVLMGRVWRGHVETWRRLMESSGREGVGVEVDGRGDVVVRVGLGKGKD
jgi:hypothetical protein